MWKPECFAFVVLRAACALAHLLPAHGLLLLPAAGSGGGSHGDGLV